MRHVRVYSRIWGESTVLCCPVSVGRNNEVGIGRDGELENLMDLSIPRADRSLQSERGK